jgi:hypothetical protein
MKANSYLRKTRVHDFRLLTTQADALTAIMGYTDACRWATKKNRLSLRSLKSLMDDDEEDEQITPYEAFIKTLPDPFESFERLE